ncbi:hypothetical protein YUBABA_00300 [Serratia phage vB_SmaM-Yubaba]|nr:hypothetical protein SUREIYA_02080 [Serratia phage vB_SmaM-Sureiya]UQT03236.1 hypothetical protein YUBABA_00300 [Serratia phage vB_SmaM-Yubaba]
MEKTSIKPPNIQNDIKRWDKFPIALKAISGFSSCITVNAESAIFILSIHLSVTGGVSTWPGILTALIMMMGPIIIAWNFVNARAIITTILTSPEDNPGGEPVAKQIVVPQIPSIVTANDFAIERELVGPTSVILRAIAGAVSTHVICFCSLLFTWTIHDSMISGKPLPSNSELLLVVIGPVVTSWNFVRASATINTVIQGANKLEKFRTKLASWIQPK